MTATISAPPGVKSYALTEDAIDEAADALNRALAEFDAMPLTYDAARRPTYSEPPAFVLQAAAELFALVDTLGDVPTSRISFLIAIQRFRESLEQWMTTSPQFRSPSARNVWTTWHDALRVQKPGPGRKPLGTPLELLKEFTGKGYDPHPMRSPSTEVLVQIARQHRRRDERGNWDVAWVKAELESPTWSQADWIDGKAAKRAEELQAEYSQVQIKIAARAGRPLPPNSSGPASGGPAVARPARFIRGEHVAAG